MVPLKLVRGTCLFFLLIKIVEYVFVVSNIGKRGREKRPALVGFGLCPSLAGLSPFGYAPCLRALHLSFLMPGSGIFAGKLACVRG